VAFLNTLEQIGGQHGPSTPGSVASIIMMILGIFFAMAALSRETRVRGAFGRGSGESVPINKAGRIVLLVAAAVLFIVGLRGLIH
jgi:hypothetical protein